MAPDRVDKQWQTKGIAAYSTEAILGTLSHYGAKADEASFRKMVETMFPLQIAEEWHKGWKGTGQFSKFPAMAADELWRRLAADRLAPTEFALALVKLMNALEGMREGKPDAPVGDTFKAVNELKAKVPLENGKPAERFVAETAFHMGQWFQNFNHLAEALAKDGHIDDAEDFAGIEGFLFPSRAEVSRAVVRAAKGEKDAAIVDVEALAGREGADKETRLTAVDALIHFEAFEKAKPHAIALLSVAEKEKDFHFALEVGERLKFLVNKLGPSPERAQILTRLAELQAAHDEAHPHHHHHHHG